MSEEMKAWERGLLEQSFGIAARLYFGEGENPVEGVAEFIAILEAHAEDHHEESQEDDPGRHPILEQYLRSVVGLLKLADDNGVPFKTRLFLANQAVVLLGEYDGLNED